LNNIKLDNFFIANAADSLGWVVLQDGSSMNKDIFVGVISGDEAISSTDVEPFNGSTDFGFNDGLLCSCWFR